NLDQPLEARNHLERSLMYGEAPLGADAYHQGMKYRELLEAQLARVKVACGEPGAEVALDGSVLFDGPGTMERFVLPGEHRMVATKPGFPTASHTLAMAAGTLTSYVLCPVVDGKSLLRRVRRWDARKLWAVLGGAGALTAVGAL